MSATISRPAIAPRRDQRSTRGSTCVSCGRQAWRQSQFCPQCRREVNLKFREWLAVADTPTALRIENGFSRGAGATYHGDTCRDDI